MSPFGIPNEASTPYLDLAEPDSADFTIMAAADNGFYVISGCVATVTGSNLTVTIAAGVVVVNGLSVSPTSTAVVLPTAAADTNPRIDLIVVDSTGAVVRRPATGTANANANPVFPTWNTASETVLYEVYMPAGVATVGAAQLSDKRMMSQPHSGVAHTGDVIPNGADQTLGTGSMNLQKRTRASLHSGGAAPANTRTVYDLDYSSQAGTGLTATALPQITVRDASGVDIPMEAPLYGMCDWLIIFDGTSYRAKNMKTGTIDYVSNTSLHYVHNPAAITGGVASNVAADLDCGSSIYLATPPGNHEFYTDGPLQMQMGETLVGPGRGFKIRPSSSFPTGGAAASAVIDAYTDTATSRLVGRVTISGLTIHGATPAGSQKVNLIGILQRRPTNNMSPAGGDTAKSEIWNNEVMYFDGAGIQLGLASNPSEATANVWQHHNFLHDGGSASKNIAIYIGDSEIGEGMQSTVANGGPTGGFPLYIAASMTTVEGASHYGFTGGTGTNACITIASGSGARVIGAYCDNVNAAAGAGVYTAGAKTKIQNVWVNAGGQATDLSAVGFIIDGAQDCMIDGCSGEGNNANAPGSPTTVVNFLSMVKLIGSPANLSLNDNNFRYCANVYSGTGTPAVNENNSVFYSSDRVQTNYTYRYSDRRGASQFATATTKVVDHGLDRAPVGVLLTSSTAGSSPLWANTFTAPAGATPGRFTANSGASTTANFYWEAWT